MLSSIDFGIYFTNHKGFVLLVNMCIQKPATQTLFIENTEVWVFDKQCTCLSVAQLQPFWKSRFEFSRLIIPVWLYVSKGEYYQASPVLLTEMSQVVTKILLSVRCWLRRSTHVTSPDAQLFLERIAKLYLSLITIRLFRENLDAVLYRYSRLIWDWAKGAWFY